MLFSGRAFSSFGLSEFWLGEWDTNSSLRTSEVSQPSLATGHSSDLALNSGRQKSPDLT